MKKILKTLIALVVAALHLTPSCAQGNPKKGENMNETKKVLVAFFSRTGENYAVGHIEKGNTHIIAEMIAEERGGTLFRIEPAAPYPDNYKKCIEMAKQELNAKARPAIQGDIDIEEYDTVFIGYPNWWADMPMPVYTFVEKHDWMGKTVIPFCTHEGSGLSGTEAKLKSACKGATVLSGLAVRGATAQNKREQAKQSVTNWIKKLK